ncbi:MAG: ATP-binding protein [Flavobacteriia bacterium]|nr:ATP-binding protein [Flavobacteriia bacterium]
MRIDRKQVFIDNDGQSIFFWGARQTGKSTLLKKLFPNALLFDLLLSDVYKRLLTNPEYLRETILAQDKKLVIIDEIQRIPILLNEVHWLIVNHNIQFILSGSSPRKITRSGENLLGGRALKYSLFPLTSTEIPNFDLERALNNGLLPRHYLSENPKRMLASYIGNYLQDEIVAEAKIRNVDIFARFLNAAAFSQSEIVNFTSIATDCGVSATTIKEYFQILEDTLLGYFIPVFQKKPKRRVIKAPKFYFFDLGIVNSLLNRGKIEKGSELFGHALESFIFQELIAHRHYSGLEYKISYWRTASQIEVDFILGDHEVSIEVKSSNLISSKHLSGLKAFSEEYEVKKSIIICNEPIARIMNDILILPWKDFLENLWNGEIIY